jgi:hypothetical protein
VEAGEKRQVWDGCAAGGSWLGRGGWYAAGLCCEECADDRHDAAASVYTLDFYERTRETARRLRARMRQRRVETRTAIKSVSTKRSFSKIFTSVRLFEVPVTATADFCSVGLEVFQLPADIRLVKRIQHPGYRKRELFVLGRLGCHDDPVVGAGGGTSSGLHRVCEYGGTRYRVRSGDAAGVICRPGSGGDHRRLIGPLPLGEKFITFLRCGWLDAPLSPPLRTPGLLRGRSVSAGMPAYLSIAG